jgi:hypothetical protein
MKKQVLLLLSLAFILTGCFFPMRMTRIIGSGEVITESRRINNFSAVELSGVGTLIITQGDAPALEITAEKNIMPYLQSTVRGNNLELGLQDFVSVDPRAEIIYRLTVTDLERIETSGLGNIEIGSLETEKLDLKISGSGNVHINELIADGFKLEVSGLGNIEIAGRVQEQRIDMSGAGNYHAGDLYSEDANVDISGTGRATVWAEKNLTVELSGMGSVQYYGSPILSTDMSGAGSIQSLGEK